MVIFTAKTKSRQPKWGIFGIPYAWTTRLTHLWKTIPHKNFHLSLLTRLLRFHNLSGGSLYNRICYFFSTVFVLHQYFWFLPHSFLIAWFVQCNISQHLHVLVETCERWMPSWRLVVQLDLFILLNCICFAAIFLICTIHIFNQLICSRQHFLNILPLFGAVGLSDLAVDFVHNLHVSGETCERWMPSWHQSHFRHSGVRDE